MNYGKVKRIIIGQSSKLGMKLEYQDGVAVCTKDTIILPREIPTSMAGALLGLWYHEKDHWKSRDCHWTTRYPIAFRDALNVVQDLRCDHRAVTREADGIEAYKDKMDWSYRKFPPKVRQQQHFVMQVCCELIFRGHPHEVGRGKGTKNIHVKRWFKKHKEWRKCIAECQRVVNGEPGYKTLLKWAEWLMKGTAGEVLGIPADKVTDAAIEKLLGEILGAGGLGQGHSLTPGAGGGFAGVEPHDLEVPKPKVKLVDELGEFFREIMEEKDAFETGAINPAKLPEFWREPEDMFQVDQQKRNKTIKVYLVSDSSGSTGGLLPSRDTVYQAIGKAMGLVCEACEKVKDTYGYEIITEATAFNFNEHTLKEFDDQYDRGKLMRRFTASVGGGTDLDPTMERIEGIPAEMGTKEFVFLFTDAKLCATDIKRLSNISGDKKWVTIAVGSHIPKDDPNFRYVAQDTPEVELALVKAIKEEMSK